MRWPFRRRHRPAVQRISLEGIDGRIPLRLQLDQLPEIRHVIRHEPIPMPVRAEVVFKRMDGSDAWRGHINPGRGMLTMLDLPLTNINPKFSPADFMRLEFRWER